MKQSDPGGGRGGNRRGEKRRRKGAKVKSGDLLESSLRKGWVKCGNTGASTLLLSLKGMGRMSRRFLPWFHWAVFPLQWSEKYTSYYLSHFSGKNQQRARSLSSCRKHFLWLREKPSRVPNSHHHSHPVYYRPHIHQCGPQEKGKRVCFITSSNKQPVRWSKQYYSLDVSVWYFTVTGDN